MSSQQRDELGGRIRRYRKQRGLSLRDVSQRGGFSPSLLSRVERGQVSPSLAVFQQIASALDLPMSAFYDNPSEPPRESFPPRQPAQVVRWNERKTISLPESSLVYQLLSPDLRGAIEFLWVEIAPGETMAASRYQHRGEECLVLIKGSNYHIWVDDQEYVLNVGDSIRHQGMSVHRSANLGNETAIVVVAISPPSF